MYICIYVCMYVYMYECSYVCMHVCMYIYVGTYVCMYVCFYGLYIMNKNIWTPGIYIYIYVSKLVCICKNERIYECILIHAWYTIVVAIRIFWILYLILIFVVVTPNANNKIIDYRFLRMFFSISLNSCSNLFLIS